MSTNRSIMSDGTASYDIKEELQVLGLSDPNNTLREQKNKWALRAFAVVNGLPVGGTGCFIKNTDSVYVGEWTPNDGSGRTYVVRRNTKTGLLQAAIVTSSGNNNHYAPYPAIGGEKDPTDHTAIYLSLLNDELVKLFHQIWADFPNNSEDTNLSAIGEVLDILENEALQISIPASGEVETLTNTAMERRLMRGVLLAGKSVFIQPEDNATVVSGKTVGSLRRMLTAWIQSHPRTPEEEELIPHFPDDFLVPYEVEVMAMAVVQSSKLPVPLRQFLWRGTTGYGKSTGVEILACILNTPLLRLTCHTDMVTADLTSRFIPVSPAVAAAEPLPDFDFISNDPDGAWENMTGETVEGKTCAEVMAERDRLLIERSGHVPPVKMVESNFIKACKEGWIVEMQEMSRIKDSGVMVGLNEYDRPNALIPLADGSFCRRHKDAIVVYTDNVGYAGCRPIDQAVNRRCKLTFDNNELPKPMCLRRAKANSGWTDTDETLEKLYNIWDNTRLYCQSQGITDGSCSVVEFENFCTYIQLFGLGKLEEAFELTIGNKCSSDPDDKAAIKTAIMPMLSAI